MEQLNLIRYRRIWGTCLYRSQCLLWVSASTPANTLTDSQAHCSIYRVPRSSSVTQPKIPHCCCPRFCFRLLSLSRHTRTILCLDHNWSFQSIPVLQLPQTLLPCPRGCAWWSYPQQHHLPTMGLTTLNARPSMPTYLRATSRIQARC